MIKIDNIDVYGLHTAIRGMRNPMNSWDRSDTVFVSGIDGDDVIEDIILGQNDLNLMQTLVDAGRDHRKFLRYITVSMDIAAPLYWWKEFDTYKVGTVANSCSTMHTIHKKPLTFDDFSTEHLTESSRIVLGNLIKEINYNRMMYVDKNDKSYWWQIIQLLPSSFNQKRTIMLNYEVLRNMYHSRKNHKLDEWREFCKMIEELPYAKELITNG